MKEVFGQLLLARYNAIANFGQLIADRERHFPGRQLGWERLPIMQLREQVVGYLEQTEALGLDVTHIAAAELLGHIESARKLPGDKFVIPQLIYLPIRRSLSDACTTIRRELELRKLVIIDGAHSRYFEPKQSLFGDRVEKKFKGARPDVVEAATCLALGRSTACVFHLMRAMEVAVKKLATKIGMTVTEKTTWVVLTGGMEGKIKKMPEGTKAAQTKKEAWEDARLHLHQLGKLVRNKTMHPTKSYTSRQAEDVFDATRVAMQSLCVL